MTSFIQQYGPEIAEWYRVCAITPGEKAPMGRAWQEKTITPEQCASFPTPDAGIGIICGKGEHPCYALDFDIEGDPEAAKEALAFARESLKADDGMLYRVGMAPKFLIPVTAVEPSWRKCASRWFKKDGKRARLEFLGDGQQFVAAAVHPGTGQPYRWHGTPILGDMIDPPELLPSVDQAQIALLIEGFERIMLKHGWFADGKEVLPTGNTALMADLTPQYPLGLSIEEAKALLDRFDVYDDYEQWVRVGMALHHEFGRRPDVSDALMLFDEWSRKSEKYGGYETVKEKWESFGRYKGGLSVTMKWVRAEVANRLFDKGGEMTEAGRAVRFARYYCDTLRYGVDTGRWYRWDGFRWRMIMDAEAMSLATYSVDELLRDDITALCTDDDMKKKLSRFYTQMQLSDKPKKILNYAKGVDTLWVKASQFDSDPTYFAVANGVLNLDTLELEKPSQSQMVSKTSYVDYDPEATCPTWEKALLDIFEGDTAMADYIQRVFGYAMLGYPDERKMVILFGNGANGKSTIINTIRDIFGEYGHVAESSLVTTKSSFGTSSGAANPEVMALRRKRLVIMSEADEKSRMQEAKLKSLVSLDTISGRGLYENTISEFKPSWLLVMAANHIPTINGLDDGIWSRIHIVPFTRNFERDPKGPDRTLDRKLKAEYSGILNWLLEGIRKYRKDKLKAPEKIQTEVAEKRDEMDMLGEWLAERCEVKDGNRCPVGAAYQSWRAFAESRGELERLASAKALTTELKRRGIRSKLASFHGKVCRCYDGLSLTDLLGGQA